MTRPLLPDSIFTTARSIAASVGAALLPQTCVACDVWIDGRDDVVCGDCRAALEQARSQLYCPRCGRAVPTASLYDRGCGRCVREDHWNVAGIARAANYATPAIRSALLNLKFGGGERVAGFLGELLAHAIRQQSWSEEVDALVPVPMHRLRRWQRHCDHARELATATAYELGIAVNHAAVRRRKYTISQTRAPSKNQRFENVAGCFGPTRRANVRGKTVCIIDNLIVTGATLHEVAKTLRRSGALTIYAAAVARSVMPGDQQAELSPPDSAA